ncbi:TonB-dependent receptor [Cellvibrio polysaccharolyticus]|uniref:TonB-dependent receptor n=1 Tax=Cellvibrio polysaccharolyticus TaxID=2082724 RepID=A0A928V0C0_9GAMM|nr:TonB-dependent receptor [Cellvibrio polysaccharolyticus]MBE8716491.1 TonB-dependent receptor [Cellvibrio polysaccharolyticus]
MDKPRHSLFKYSALSLVIHALALPAFAQESSTDQPRADIEEVLITGYRKSLTDAASAKRQSVNVSESVFAEDIGKFPDLNIAESINRMPGIQLIRDMNGEGMNIAIRGLGTNFTKITLNGAQIGVASSGRIGSQNQNREVDLDVFPTELFTRLDVNKSPVASMSEGGLSGTVDMRSARPFDNPGTHVNYQLQGSYGEINEKVSPRGSLTASWTNDDDTFGVLVGVAAVNNKSTITGYETIGWTTPALTDAQCGGPAANCNLIGGNGYRIPDTVPNGVGNGLVPGTPIDAAYLQSLNPGLDINQIANGLTPRLNRPSYIDGTRDRISGLVSLEFRPTDDLNFYLDTLWADAERDFDRLAMNWVGRNGAVIPMNMEVDSNNVVTSGTFANAQFFLEARPYKENLDFYNINPGVSWTINDQLRIDAQINKGRSEFFRESPSILVATPMGQGITVDFNNKGGNFPSVSTNVDLNDPDAGWSWNGGRLNISNEKRVVETEGARFDVRFGDDVQNIKFGLAFDDISRRITSYDNSPAWEDITCRGLNPDGSVPDPRPGCVGGELAAIPDSQLGSYLKPGPHGFITVDFDRLKKASNYAELNRNAPESDTAATGAKTGFISEETLGAYIELNTESEIAQRILRTNFGVRYVTTDQRIDGPVTLGGERSYQSFLSDYDAFLPSFNSAYNVSEDVILRMSASRTMTRANPSNMLPNTTFSDPSAQEAVQGNPNLAPYLSTNFDIGGEWYTGEEGYIGLTLFKKQITGFTVLGTNTVSFQSLGIPFDTLTDIQQSALNSRGGPGSAMVSVAQQVNSGQLDLTGQELTLVQPLNNVLEGLGFSANYTHISQEGKGSGAPAKAVGVAPVTWNFTGYWENFGASIRLSYTWNDKQTISGPNQNSVPDAELKTDARGQWDLSASYSLESLPTSPQITLNVINLTGESSRNTFQHDNATYEYYDPGFSVMLGLRGKF